jgi:hypothetical protein
MESLIVVDMLQAGNGILATNILGDLIEYRGHSWWYVA